MAQRRRWVLSDMANMLLVFKNIFKLARKNDSFSIAYILYMIQMFSIVLLSPASTVVIIAGKFSLLLTMNNLRNDANTINWIQWYLAEQQHQAQAQGQTHTQTHIEAQTQAQVCGPVGCLINRSTCSHTTIFHFPPDFTGSLVVQFIFICKMG